MDIIGARVVLQGARQASVQARQVGASIRQIGSDAKAASTQLKGLSAGTLGVLGAGSGGLLGTLGAIGVSYNVMRDRQRVAFTSLLGSGKRAETMMNRIQKLAEDSPTLDPKTTGAGVQRLMAFGFAADQALVAVQRIADGALLANKTVEEAMAPAALALGQIQSKGKLASEEMNQLAENVGFERPDLAKQLGFGSGGEFEAALNQGKITAEKAIPAILAVIDKKAGGAARRYAETTEGRFLKLKEVSHRALGDFFEPLFNSFGPVFTRLSNLLGKLNPAKAGWDLKRKLGAAFKVVGREGGKFLDALKPAMPFLKNVLLPLVTGVGKGILAGLVGAWKLALPVLKLAASALGWVGDKLKPVRKWIEGVGVVIGMVFGPGLLGAISKLKMFRGVLAPVGVALKVILIPFRALGALFGKVPKLGAAAGAGLRNAFAGISGFLAAQFDAVTRIVQGALNAIIGMYNRLFGLINAATPGAIKIGGETIIPAIPDIPQIPTLGGGRGGDQGFRSGGVGRGADTTSPRLGSPDRGVTARGASAGAVTLDAPIILQLDGREMHRSTVRREARLARAR